MKSLLMAGAAAILATTGISAGAMAQDMDHTDHYELTVEQQSMYDGWPADRRTTYDGWPSDVKSYYWTLPADRKNAFWMLNDEQRLQVYNLEPQQRNVVWGQIMAQVNSSANANASQTSATTTTNSNMSVRFVSNAVVQDAPTAARNHDGQYEYPICESEAQDHCMNPWEAGRRGPGVDRPLDYWPGRPASQMD